MQKIVGTSPPDMHRRYRKPDASNIPAMSSSAAAQRSRLVGSHADSERFEHLGADRVAELSQTGWVRSIPPTRKPMHLAWRTFPSPQCKNPRLSGGGSWLREPDDYLL
ncbi:hypothetical protein, partial [Burkholderia vietnamiensis]|uniref:hypothetical protein n=1 Tax=Burkholderia vietnamiensis TaxID=60552 RepID=UPI001E61E9D0